MRIAGFGWVASSNWLPLAAIRDLAKADLNTAWTLIGYSWMADDLTRLELQTIFSLGLIAREDPEFARLVVSQPFMEPPFRDRGSFAVQALSLMVLETPQMNVIPLLKEQPWFSDGLDDDEAALLTVMRSEAYISKAYRRALIESHEIVTKSIELPLAGDTELIIITHNQSVDYDDIFTAMEVGLRSHEAFLDLRFPVNDVIFLVGDSDLWKTGAGGLYLGSRTSPYFKVNHPVRIRSIYHELAHYYFTDGKSRWMNEGGADFLRTVAEIQIGATSIDQRLRFLEDEISSLCRQTIREHLIDWRRSNCDYLLGERLLWHMYVVLGQEIVAASLRDFVLASRELMGTEENFYNIFLRNTPPDRLRDFRRVYEEFHGGTGVE